MPVKGVGVTPSSMLNRKLMPNRYEIQKTHEGLFGRKLSKLKIKPFKDGSFPPRKHSLEQLESSSCHDNSITIKEGMHTSMSQVPQQNTMGSRPTRN